jgi:hypothetical protein
MNEEKLINYLNSKIDYAREMKYKSETDKEYDFFDGMECSLEDLRLIIKLGELQC